MTVATNVQRAQEATNRYRVASVPLMIVNGKYTTGRRPWPAATAQLLSLINDLAASEKKR